MAEEIVHNEDESGNESPVMKGLRSQIRDLERELKARPAREEVEAELRAQLKREEAAAAQLIEQGHPAGLARFMLSEIGDAEVTPETVSGFLQGLGFDSKPVSSDGDKPASQDQQLAEVTSLASRVSAAASGAPADSVMARLQAARSPAEVNAIMEEIGAAQST